MRDGSRPMPTSRGVMVVGFYAGLAMLAIVFSAGRGDPDVYRLDEEAGALSLLLGPALGLGVGLAIVVASILASRRYAWARGLEAAFRDLLGPLSSREVFLLAAASSIGEELLFRGALLSWLGLWPQAVIFALLHVGPGKRFLPWTASALVLGLGLGLASQATGNLGAAIVAHFVINFLNLRRIVGIR
ncbi:MAG: CPBP family intramembrane metalloprotease [Kofleriaceae bacterium]|nr:CPBP family intramembrane metalloprotease [Kofleriaceae bacterium]